MLFVDSLSHHRDFMTPLRNSKVPVGLRAGMDDGDDNDPTSHGVAVLVMYCRGVPDEWRKQQRLVAVLPEALCCRERCPSTSCLRP